MGILFREGLSGGAGGGEFTDPDPGKDARVSDIEIHAGLYIDAIQTLYRRTNNTPTFTAQHGGDGGGRAISAARAVFTPSPGGGLRDFPTADSAGRWGSGARCVPSLLSRSPARVRTVAPTAAARGLGKRGVAVVASGGVITAACESVIHDTGKGYNLQKPPTIKRRNGTMSFSGYGWRRRTTST